MHYILYNKKSNNQNSENAVNELINKLGGENRKISVFDISNYNDFFAKIKEDDDITLIGGDGTLNHFLNDTLNIEYPCDIYYTGGGTGNDFQNDTADKLDEFGRVKINEYSKNLPKVFVNGIEKVFVNGIGFGIDGYACEVADEIAAKSPQKKINYASISIKGLLFHYKRPNAEVMIDGKSYSFKKVYLASSMKGRYYGGGMKVAPDQDRLNPDHSLTLVILSGKSRIGTLLVFPKIFKGEHVKNPMTTIMTGHNIEVRFDKPTALQIDGETVKNVYSYKVIA